MSDTRRRLPLKAHKQIWFIFTLMLTIFVLLATANEVLDLPHYIFGDERTDFSQRRGEVILELSIYFIVVFSSYYYIRKKIREEIKILEGFIPICAKCKKIRQDLDWKTLEEYISANSLAKFTHTICPDCVRILYPEQADRLLQKKNDRA